MMFNSLAEAYTARVMLNLVLLDLNSHIEYGTEMVTFMR